MVSERRAPELTGTAGKIDWKVLPVAMTMGTTTVGIGAAA
jgi:hypothetical protein